MNTMICLLRVRARVSQRCLGVGSARPCGGDTHTGETRWRVHVHILKTTSIHVSVMPGPALKRQRGPRTAAFAARGRRA